jgi:hypothetical protein
MCYPVADGVGMSDDDGTSSYPASQDFPPPPLIGAEHEPTAVGPGDAGGLPPSPIEAEGPAPAPRRSRILKVVGVLLIVLGALLLLAAPSQFGRIQDGPLIVMMILAVGTLAGGVHFVRHGWWTGHDVRNVIAVLPPAVLIALVVVGNVAGGGAPRPFDDLSRALAAGSDYRLTAGSVWADYADPQVSAKRWVRTVDEAMPSLETSLATLHAEIARIQDVDMRADWEALADLLDEELSLIVDIRNAVDRLDVRAERAAQRRLLEVQHEGAELVRRLLSESGAQPS